MMAQTGFVKKMLDYDDLEAMGTQEATQNDSSDVKGYWHIYEICLVWFWLWDAVENFEVYANVLFPLCQSVSL